jgi:hypothetical protein
MLLSIRRILEYILFISICASLVETMPRPSVGIWGYEGGKIQIFKQQWTQEDTYKLHIPTYLVLSTGGFIEYYCEGLRMVKY